MHEYHIVEEIVKQVLEKAQAAGAAKVTAVALVIGAGSGLEESSVRLYFAECAKGTIAAGAVLTVTAKPVSLRCNTCDRVFDYKIGEFNCPHCGNLGVKVSSPKDVYIDHIEIES